MGNIFKVLRRDFLRLFKVPAAWVILFGMVFIPPLYSWYNIVGFWDPYGNTKGITVAIANNDDGTDNALIGKQNLGDQIVKQMRSNDQLGWTFVTEAEAMDQVESGKAFVSTVSEVLTEVINTVDGKAISTEDTTKAKALTALAKASDDVQHTRSTIAKLTTKLTDTPEQTRTARQALDDARTLGIDTAEGLAGVSTLIGTTQTSLNGFVTSTSEALDQGSSLLSQAAAQANQSVGTVTGTISAANQQVGGLINTAEDINQANADIIDQLKGLPNANREPLQSAIATLESRNSELAGALGNLDSLNTTIGNASTDTAGLAQHLNTATQTTVREANTARGTITSGAIPQLNTGLNALSSTASTLSTGITSQGSLIDQSKHALDQLDKAASTTVTALRDTDKALAGVQTKLDTLVTDIKALSISSSLSSLIGTDGKLDAATIADFMLSPTVISEQAVYPVASYGSGMAPLFTTLSLWVGAFVLVVIPKLETDDEGIDDLTPTQGYLGRFLLLATLAAVQGLVTAIGDLVIGIQCASAPVFLLTCVITSLVYMSVIFALSTTFMHVGKGVCVALVILQVPGASGLYPIEMMPAFFRAIYPLLPFTYSIDAMRETIGGFYDGLWFVYIGKLLVFAVLAFAREIKESDMIIGEPVHLPGSEYRVTQAIAALADRDEYRHAIERRAAKFAYQYPRLLLGALIAGFVVPAALIIVFALTTSEKIVVMGTWLAWVLIIMGFLMVVEFMRDSIRRQTELGNLSDESIRAMLYGHKAKRRDTSAERHEEADPSAAVTAIIPTIPPTKEGRHAR